MEIFFYGHDEKTPLCWLSQWYPCCIVEDENKFSSAESYMMFHKAMLFGDEAAAKKILAADDPKKVKTIGRQVKNFDEDIWAANRVAIVYKGNMLKFKQNEDLREKILRLPVDAILIEASPYDRIWGIGFSATTALANRSRWGTNLLGQILTKVMKSVRKRALSLAAKK